METAQNAQAIVDQLIQALADGIVTRDSFTAKQEELLMKSEDRIDATNKMITKLVNAIELLHSEYDHHLSHLTECRDALMRQNEKLLKEAALLSHQKDKLIALLEEKEKAHQKSEADWRALLRDMVVSGRPQTNINV